MERIEYNGIVDKSDWQRGPWDCEPDKIRWQDEATGLPCLIVRGPIGALCGYVGVHTGHPLHGKEYDAADVSVHGGLTFAHGCATIDRSKWEEFRKRVLAWRDEAKRYPVGDAARRLKEWGDCLDSYEAWAERARARYICHSVPEGEPDDVWWFGFDCAHLGDLVPERGGRSLYRDHSETYKTVSYVQRECAALARQLADVRS